MTDNAYTINLRETIEAGKKSVQKIHKKTGGLEVKQFSNEEKMKKCSKQTGYFLMRKDVDKTVKYKAFYCHICDKCIADQVQKQEAKFEKMWAKARQEAPDAVWFEKIVDKNSNEAKALKKRISRNQGGRHMEFEAEDPDKMVILAFVEPEEGKSQEDLEAAYGTRKPNPAIDFDKVVRAHKKSKSKISRGKGLKVNEAPKTSSAPKKQAVEDEPEEDEEIELRIPQALISEEDKDKAIDIFYNTNLLQYAMDGKHLQKLIYAEYGYISDECKKADVKICGVTDYYVKMSEKMALKMWNDAVKREVYLQEQMSINPVKEEESLTAEMDITRNTYTSIDTMLINNWPYKGVDPGIKVDMIH